jgi:hypothetical protein
MSDLAQRENPAPTVAQASQAPPASQAPQTTQRPPEPKESLPTTLKGRDVKYWTNFQVTLPTPIDIWVQSQKDSDNVKPLSLTGEHEWGNMEVIGNCATMYGTMEENIASLRKGIIKEALPSGSAAKTIDKGEFYTASGVKIAFESVGAKTSDSYKMVTTVIIDTKPKATVLIYFDTDSRGYQTEFTNAMLKSIVVNADETPFLIFMPES